MTPYMECFDLPFFFSPISLGLMPAMTGTSFLSLSLFFFFFWCPLCPCASCDRTRFYYSTHRDFPEDFFSCHPWLALTD